MTLARLVNYVDGNILTGPQLNNEFDNILNNGNSLITLAPPVISIVQGLSGSISTAGVGSFAALSYQLRSTTISATISATSSFNVNAQTGGPIAGGRDQAAALGSTDIHYYAISTGGTSTTVVGICSSNPPPLGPTLPAGYSAWAYLVSAKYSTGSSGFGFPMFVNGARASYTSLRSVVAGAVATGSTYVVSPTAATTYVPRGVATRIYLSCTYGGVADNTGNLDVALDVQPSSNAVSAPSENLEFLSSRMASSQFIECRYPIMSIPVVSNPPVIWYRLNLFVGTSAGAAIDVVGYSVPNGDLS